MRLCLTCFRLWPVGAQYCGYCGRSFGGRICRTKKAHRNPPGAQYCVQCGSPDLTDGTPYLPLGCLNRILAWGSIGLVVRWLWLQIAGLLRAGAILGHSTRLDISPAVILNRCVTWLLLLFLLNWFVSWLLSLFPGEAGKQLRSSVAGASKLVLKTGPQLLKEGLRLAFCLGKATFQLLQTVVEGSTGKKS